MQEDEKSFFVCSLRVKAVQESLKQAVFNTENNDQEEAQDMFGEKDGKIDEDDIEGDGSGADKQWRRKQRVLQAAPPTVTVKLSSTSYVEMKVPKTWKESDFVVPLEAASLTSLCDYICEDLSFLEDGKRSYAKTSNYSKKAKVAAVQD